MSSPIASPGQVLGGRYRLGPEIGSGAMGVVHEAVQESLGRNVAIKVLRPILAGDQDMVARFRAEAERAARLNHPHVVQVIDFGHEPTGLLWIAMERLVGTSLRDRMQAGRPSVDDALGIIDDVLKALEAAHAAKLIHRDLKPGNIFLAEVPGLGTVAKVLDFGIAKLLDGDAASKLTGTGVVLGTPLYMAPEQLRGGPIDARADLYSVGAVLYELLSGRTPHIAVNYHELMFKIVAEEPTSLGALCSEIPGPVATAVDRALSRTPEARFPNAQTMRRELSALRGGASAADDSGSADSASGIPPTSSFGAFEPSDDAHDAAIPSPVSPVAASAGPGSEPGLSSPAHAAGSAAASPAPARSAPSTMGLLAAIGGLLLVAGAGGGTAAWLALRSDEGPTNPSMGPIAPATAAPAPVQEPQMTPEPMEPTPPEATPMANLSDEASTELSMDEASAPETVSAMQPASTVRSTRMVRRRTPVAIRYAGSSGNDVYSLEQMRPVARSVDGSSCWRAGFPLPVENTGDNFHVTVNANGAVTHATVALPNPQRPPGFDDCMAAKLKALNFGPTTNPGTFRIYYAIYEPRR